MQIRILLWTYLWKFPPWSKKKKKKTSKKCKLHFQLLKTYGDTLRTDLSAGSPDATKLGAEQQKHVSGALETQPDGQILSLVALMSAGRRKVDRCPQMPLRSRDVCTKNHGDVSRSRKQSCCSSRDRPGAVRVCGLWCCGGLPTLTRSAIICVHI